MHTCLTALTCCFFGIAAAYGTPVTANDVQSTADEHAHHHHVQDTVETRRSALRYQVPDVELVRDDGRHVTLPAEMNDGRPVVLAFIYTSCTTVCPLTSQTLSTVQQKLGESRDLVHIMSISIDPEQDTPARLRQYAKTFHAGPQWQHYTGTLAASQRVQRAFDVYRGDKMDHAPAVLIRRTPGEQWVRIDGFATAEQVLAELPSVQELHVAR
jgi:protein SCO1